MERAKKELKAKQTALQAAQAEAEAAEGERAALREQLEASRATLAGGCCGGASPFTATLSPAALPCNISFMPAAGGVIC